MNDTIWLFPTTVVPGIASQTSAAWILPTSPPGNDTKALLSLTDKIMPIDKQPVVILFGNNGSILTGALLFCCKVIPRPNVGGANGDASFGFVDFFFDTISIFFARLVDPKRTSWQNKWKDKIKARH
jgi:hypothetical protein